MGYVKFSGEWRTLQLSFDFNFPEYQITGRQFSGVGYDSWIIIENQLGNDNRLIPGENVTVSGFNAVTNSIQENSALDSFKYEGMVDLDGNGFLESVVVSRFSAAFVLTDLRQFIDFQPFSTTVILNPIQLDLLPLPEEEPEYNIIGGTREDDILVGRSENDLMIGERGDDNLNGRGGDDVIDGGKGKDLIEGGKGDDGLFGGKGSDGLNGSRGDDLIDGGAGKDLIDGGKGNDALWGGKGRDSIFGGKGDDSFFFDTKSSYDSVMDYKDGESLVIDRDGDFSGSLVSDIRILERVNLSKLYVGDDLVAKILGELPTIDDVIFL